MKKSQILAALALAFALGVVAPVASASAYVMAGEGHDEVVDGINTALNKANGLTDCSGTNENTLIEYGQLINTVNTAAKNIEDATKTAYTNLKTLLSNATFVAKMHAAGTQASNATWTAYNGTEVNAYATYDTLVAYAEGLADALQTSFEGHAAWTDVKDAADYLRDGTNTSAIGGAKDTVATAKSAEIVNINNKLASMGQVTSGNTTYALAVAAAKAMPKYSNFEVIYSEYGVLYGIQNSASEGYRVVTAQKALDQFNADLANFCTTDLTNGSVETPKPDTTEPAPEKPSEDKNTPKPGNTGTIAGADATAKATVSIMAAIASVATAAFVAIRKIAAGKKA